MKRKILVPIILFVGFTMAGISINKVNGQVPQNKPQSIKYTCPMHPEVITDKPGKCPKCGMTLVEKKETTKNKMHQSKDSTMMKQDKTKMMKDTSSMKH